LPQSLTNITCFFADEPLPVRRFGSLFKADDLASANLNDHDEEEFVGSGINPGPEPDKGAAEEMVNAVRHRDTCFISY